MRMISFFFYFGQVRLGSLLGVYRTANPVDLRWRWRHWQNRHLSRRVHRRF